MISLAAIALAIYNRPEYRAVQGNSVEKPKKRVVVDAGHGGADPGKIGVNGKLEKDINLEIARLLQTYLEAEDICVIMTRTEDESADGNEGAFRKKEDMASRVKVMEKAAPAAVVSIHQNSYPEESVRGAQVFYYQGSIRGKQLAECIQSRLIAKVDPDNHREIKANDTYYLLRYSGAPCVIAECGFLTNPEEAQKLTEREYQERIAWNICVAVLQYLNKTD